MIYDKLNELIKSFQQLPYLFVGTGLSIRYADAPDWISLLRHVWKLINPDKEDSQFEKLRQKIEYSVLNDYTDSSPEEIIFHVNPRLGTELKKQFCDMYYSSSDFENLVFTTEQNENILKHHYNPFDFYISQYISNIKLNSSKDDFKEIASLAKNQNKIAGIITTNYDNVLETIFNEFSVMVGQNNLLLSNSLNIFEIFKIHGSITDPSSIVLTEKDYLEFDSKLKYLSAKLLTIFVEHPIIFLGYGLGDVNIRKLFSELAECLNNEQLSKIKDNFIFISPARGSIESYALRDMEFGKNHLSMHEFTLNDYSVLYKNLSNIQSSLPIKLARKLQDMVCNFVYSASAKNTVIFGDINSPDIDDDKTAIFFGRSDTIAEMGFSYYTIDIILEDVLFNNNINLTNVKLIEQTFKNIRSYSGSTLLPVYKYINVLNYPLCRIPSNYNIIDDYNNPNIRPTSTDIRNYIKTTIVYDTIDGIESAFPNHIPKQVAYIKKFAENIATEELGDYLRKYFYTETYKLHRSLFRKLIALYDYKKYFAK